MNKVQYQPIIQNVIAKKRQEFHKQIRRQKINEIFKSKRKILLEKHQNNNQNGQIIDYKAKYLVQILKDIKQNINVKMNVNALVNILALDRPFGHLISSTKTPTIQFIQQFCNELVNSVFCQILPSLATKQSELRICFLTAISNLFSDDQCSNINYVKLVTGSIQKMYGGIEFWQLDQQLIEVYYMIGNLMRKRICYVSLLDLEILLRWCEEGIDVLPSHCLLYIVKGLTYFFADIDQVYHNSENAQKSMYLQHFKNARLIIIEKVSKRLASTKGINSLDPPLIKGIVTLLNQNKPYLLKCISQWSQQDIEIDDNTRYFMNRLILLMNQQTFKTQIVKEVGKFFIQLISFYPLPENKTFMKSEQQRQIKFLNEQIITLHRCLLIHCFQNVLSTVCLQYMDIKIIMLKIIKEILLYSNESLKLYTKKQLYSAFEYIFQNKKLEQVILSLFICCEKYQKFQVFKQISEIYQILIKSTDGKLGIKIKENFQILIKNQNENSIPQQLLVVFQQTVKLHQQYLEHPYDHFQI